MNRFVPADNLIAPLGEKNLRKWGNGGEWAENLRKNGRSEFIKTGIPTTRIEAWKYTDLTPLTKMDFSFNPDKTDSIDNALIEKLLPGRFSECSLVFVNGKFSEHFSFVPPTKGLFIDNVRNIINSGRDDVLECIGKAGVEPDALTNLNRAYFNDGAVIRIGKDIDPGFPLHLIFLAVNVKSPEMFHPGNLIIAEEGSKFSLIEEYTGDPDSVYFTNTITEIHIKDRASVSHYKIQTESHSSFHVGSLNVIQGNDTKFSSNTATFGGALTRNNISASMNGPGSESNIEGLYFLKGAQHTDNHTEIFHNFPSCKSTENFNGVLDGESRAVFDGKIFVGEGSVQTDSTQSSRSLLLSGSASVDSKPALEIYADDVKCSHSASVGQLDTDSLYYLRSRGIGHNEAMKILTSGFLKEILEKFENKDVSGKIENLLNSEIKV